MSAAFEMLPNQRVKVADSPERLPIDGLKATDSLEKLPIDDFMALCQENKYNTPTLNNLHQLYDLIDVNQIFGAIYISKELNCSERTGRNLLAKLREIGAVIPVKGKGKGMYRLKYKNEIPKNM